MRRLRLTRARGTGRLAGGGARIRIISPGEASLRRAWRSIASGSGLLRSSTPSDGGRYPHPGPLPDGKRGRATLLPLYGRRWPAPAGRMRASSPLDEFLARNALGVEEGGEVGVVNAGVGLGG